MNIIFSLDNAFFRTVGKMVDLVWVNLLTLVCTLPVVTAGASLTAMYDLLLKMAENKQGKLTAQFFRSFKANFKSATKVWLCALAVLAVYAYNLYLLDAGILDGYGIVKKISLGLIVLILFALIMLLNYIFALLARYDSGVKKTVKNAAMLSIAFFPKSFCMTVIVFFPLALTMLSDYFFWLWFLYGIAYPGYFIAMLMVSVFRRTEEARGEKPDELEEVQESEPT